MQDILRTAKRIVIKTGSSLMIEAQTGSLRHAWLDSLVEDIFTLHQRGTEVIIVTSGAVALGRKALNAGTRPLKLEEKQAAAACGQPLLVDAWRASLLKKNIHAAQLLLTIDDSENRRRYLNARNTIDTLLAAKVIPVINENDTVATAELRFGDNDRLAARVAQMASADLLIIFSDIDGLYTSNPASDPQARFVEEVRHITPEIEAMAGGSGSVVGTGGMITKLMAAKIALGAGCHMAIAKGTGNSPLKQLTEGGKATWFISEASPMAARKYWIAGSVHANGTLVVDDGAKAALINGKSLLPAGVKEIQGSFERGDAVLIKDQQGVTLGKGLSAYAAGDAARIIGHKSNEIEHILGFKGRDELIHRDDMVME